MRRATLAISAVLLLGLCAPSGWAQHEPAAAHGEKGAEAGGEHEGAGLQLWAWANFVLLAAGLVYVFRKNAVPYFVQRAIDIRQGARSS